MPHRNARLVKDSKHWRDKLRARVKRAVAAARHRDAEPFPFALVYRQPRDRVGELCLFLGPSLTTDQLHLLTLAGETLTRSAEHVLFLTEDQMRRLTGAEPIFPPGYRACGAPHPQAICALMARHGTILAHAGVSLDDEVVRW